MSIETPTGVHIGTWVQGSPEWLTARRNGLGGSEIAAVLGLSPYESRYSLWCRKRGIIGDVEQTPAMEWGHYAEPALLAWYHDKVTPVATRVGTYRHKDRPWQLANPDALAEARVVEAKTDRNPPAWGEPGTDAVPPYYRCQKLWYLDVLGWDQCDLVASLSGAPPEVWTLKYDADDAAYLRERAKDFLDSIDYGTEPPIDGHEQTYKVIREMHSDIDPDARWYVDDETAEAFERACRDEKTSKEAKRQAAARILRDMGTAQYAYAGKRRIAARQARGNGAPYLVAARG